MTLEFAFIFAAVGGGIGIYATAVALGTRHGIDWDHIAAITDITSAGAVTDEEESWLLAEPGLQLSDESHHLEHGHEGEIDEHDHAHAHGHSHDHGDGAGGVAVLEKPAVATL